MIVVSDLLDPYSRRARLQPALLAILPLGLALLAWYPTEAKTLGLVWAIVVSAGGTALLAQIARERGKRLEQRLFDSWGGKPSTVLLRHLGCRNKAILAQRHTKLRKLFPDLSIPSVDEETAHPTHADHVYEACVNGLLEKTRDRSKFRLLFDENCNYGFQRNLCALRPVGLLGAIGAGSLIAWRALTADQDEGALSVLVMVCLALDVGFIFLWMFWVKAARVRLTAEAFAERLLASCEVL